MARESGRLDEALALLERCLERRPDDVDVWRARLKVGAPWAVLTMSAAAWLISRLAFFRKPSG